MTSPGGHSIDALCFCLGLCSDPGKQATIQAKSRRRLLSGSAAATQSVRRSRSSTRDHEGGQRISAKPTDRVRQHILRPRGRTPHFVDGASIWLIAEASRPRTELLWPSHASSPSCSITSGLRKNRTCRSTQKQLEDSHVHLLRRHRVPMTACRLWPSTRPSENWQHRLFY